MSSPCIANAAPARSQRLRKAILSALGSACVGFSSLGMADTPPNWDCLANPNDSGWSCSGDQAGEPGTALAPASSRPLPRPLAQAAPAPVTRRARAAAARATGASGKVATATAAIDTAGLDAGIDWRACTAKPPGASAFAMASPDQALPIHITANSSEASTISQTALFQGDVEVRQGAQKIQAQRIRMDRGTGQLDATGQVRLERPDLRLAADQVRYNLRTQQGQADRAVYRLPTIPARGTARVAKLGSPSESEFEHISYTTCPPGNEGWVLQADRLQLNRANGLGTAYGAKLSFLGVPFMYLPELTFPIDNRRRSGLLIPKIGYSSKQGMDLTLPYYFNLAPNYDLTLIPRLMTNRGLMLGGDFRFLTSTTRGDIKGSYLPSDNRYENRSRSSLSITTSSQFTPHISGEVNYNQVSDAQYLADFGSDLVSASTSFLDRQASLRYAGDYWNLTGLVQSYQTLGNTIPLAEQPYARLPQIDFNLDRPSGSLPIRYLMNGEFVSFAKSGNFVEGQRLSLDPGISVPIRGASYYFTPGLRLHYTSYRLSGQAPGQDRTPSVTVPVFSLDSGMYFDRNTSLFGRQFTQTLEPRLRYLLVPRKNQNAIPLFDTGLADLSYAALFRDNRFVGGDRIGDANQLSVGLTSRYIDARSGRELLRLSLGQTLYFSNRTVQLSPTTAPQTSSTSPLVGEVSARLGDGWQARGDIAWDPHTHGVDSGLAQINYQGDNDRIFNFTLFKHQGVQTFTDVAASWPISEQLSVIGRWDYSLTQDHNLETLAGLEYGRCCWKIRAVLRRYADYTAGASSQQNTAFLLELELRGLGSIGDNIASLLDNGIYGYSRNHD